MVAVAVKRLALSVPSARSSEARLRVEEALRLSANNDDRLFLLRRFDFGTLPAMARPAIWQARAEARMRSLTSRAVHASDTGAASSEAVWFRSVAEARSMLLQLLASGRTPDAWFWRLALPDWGGAPLERWLPQLLSSVESDRPALIMLARAIVSALAHGESARLMRTLAILPDRRAMPRQHAGRQASSSRFSPPPTAQRDTRIVHDALRLLARHDPDVRAILARQLPDEIVPVIARYWLAHFAILAVAPDIAPASERCQAIERQWQSVAFWSLAADSGVAPIPNQQAGAVPVRSLSPPQDEFGAGEALRQSNVSSNDPSLGIRSNAAVSTGAMLRIEQANAPFDGATNAPLSQAIFSDAAGLWLLIPTLRRMGLAEWIARREDEGAEGFGQALLRQVGLRYGLASDDPLLTPLPDDLDMPADWVSAWRVGADRWLRRQAGLRLCDVVKRRGSFRFDGISVTIGFDHELADVRLRRRALDLDPGWIDWLGLSIRYHYFDRGRHDVR